MRTSSSLLGRGGRFRERVPPGERRDRVLPDRGPQLAADGAVEVHLPRDLPLVRIDALLIERVLVNLFENASKYTPPGSTVTLAAEVIGDRLSVSVSDNGPGLPPGREEAVFQKFTRGERESDRLSP